MFDLTQNNNIDAIVGELASQVSTTPIDLKDYSIPHYTVSKALLKQIKKEINPQRMFYQSQNTDPVVDYFYTRAEIIFKQIMEAIIECIDTINGQKTIPSENDIIKYNIIDTTHLFKHKTLNGKNTDYEIPLYIKSSIQTQINQLIDSLTKNVNPDDIELDRLERMAMFTLARPIFKECIYKLNKHCYASYSYSEKEITIVIYMVKYNQWMVTAILTITPKDSSPLACSNIYDIITSYSTKDIIKPLDQKIWKEFLRLQKDITAVNNNKIIKTIHNTLMTSHMMTVTYLNEKREHLTDNTTVIKATKQTRIYAPDTKQRITAHIGPIDITTNNKRTIRKLSGVIKYTTPSWDVRGHYRHYKSGKVVYIPPHTNKRKNLRAQDETIKRTIIIRDDKTKETK